MTPPKSPELTSRQKWIVLGACAFTLYFGLEQVAVTADMVAVVYVLLATVGLGAILVWAFRHKNAD
jgi:hypothetical protein